MKTLLLCLLMTTFSIMNAQESEGSRKGSFLIETGFSTFGNIFGGSTGASILSSDGESITNIGFSGGTFVSENLALRGKFNLLSGGGSTFTFISVGPKYYAAGNIPLGFELGKGFGEGGSSDFIGSASAGYAFKAASNIYFEPTISYLFPFESIGDGFWNIGGGFSLLF